MDTAGDSIRSSFLNFFEERGHQPMPSASLIPAGDPTLLFTSAGMVPFKPFFMGEQTPPRRRLTSCQKSFRTTDIDEVGDHKHLTFFEMLGNFSIGDYFRQDAAAFAWELCTGLFGLAPERMYITVHLDDDEAYDIWHDEIGIPPERIYRYGNSEQLVGAGRPGGPHRPLLRAALRRRRREGRRPASRHRRHDDAGRPYRPAAPRGRRGHTRRTGRLPSQLRLRTVRGACGTWSSCSSTRTWTASARRCPAPSVDTGMGLERAAAVLQGKPNVYETDLFRPIIDAVCGLAGAEYGTDSDTDYAIRVVAEHARAASVLISDGVVPSNSERGYVLRRIIRRAIRYGRQLGLDRPFMTDVVAAVIDRFAGAYPALDENGDFIRRVVRIEEERFAETFERGNNILRDILSSTPEEELQFISGNDAFVLYDTYGFPPELVDEIGRREYGLAVDMDGFNAEMDAKRERDRAGHQVTGDMAIVTAYENLGASHTAFDGYYQTAIESRILGILRDGEAVGHATAGQQVEIVLAETCFYAEGGGQVGDAGVIAGPNGRVRVEDTQSPVGRPHRPSRRRIRRRRYPGRRRNRPG